jgi:CheY-like chemotaxis protein
MAVAAVSGHGQEDRRTAREAGFDEAVVKPVRPAEWIRLAERGR